MKPYLLAFPLLLLTVPAFAGPLVKGDSEFIRSVSASGSCRKEIVPDKAGLNMVSEATNPRDIKLAVAEAVKNYETAKTQVQRLKLQDAELTTSEYTVTPLYDWKDNKQTLRGYQARVGLRVESSDIDRMGEAMAIAADNKLRDVGNWALFVSPVKYKQVQQDCLAEAAQDARRTAEKMVSGLGAKVGPVLSISQGGAMPQPPMPMMARAMKAGVADMAEAAPAPSIEAGRQEISVNVQASFMLE